MLVDGPSSPPFSFRSPSGNIGSGMVMPLDATNDEDFDVFSNSTPHRLHELSPNTSSFFSAKKPNFSTAATMDVHFTEWFNEIIERRKNLSAVAVASVVFLSLFLILNLLQISIIHPIDSIFNIFATFFSWKVWLLFLACGLSTFLSVKYGFLNLISANQLRHLSIWAKSNWISALIFTALFHINTMAVIGATSIQYLDPFSITVLTITLFFGTLFTVFRTDHQLVFEEPELGTKILPMLKAIYVERGQALALSASISAAKIYRNIYIPALVIGLPIFGSPILWSIVDFRLHAIALLTLAFTIFTVDSAIIFTRFFVMEPISFPLPPPYAVVAPSGSQLRTLTNALQCSDPLLKLFAGYDLRRVGACDLTRRGEVYALSQPGGHPRNWTSISNSCFAIIQRIQKEIEHAASEYLLPCELNEESPDRKMLLMPSSMRNQIYTSAARQRVNRALLRPHKQKMNKGNILAGIIPSKYYEKFFSWMTPDKMVISRYDANVAAYAIEGISWLIVKSLQEDKFGVVQRDIHRLTSLLILTMQTIDKYFGVRNVRPVANGPDAPLLLLGRVLRNDIKNITDTFSSYLRELQFTPEELRIIELLK